MRLNTYLLVVMLAVIGILAIRVLIDKEDPKLPVDEGQFDVMFYRNGRPVKTGQLSPKSAATGALQSLLKSRNGMWKRSLVSYAPNLYLRAPDFTINIGRSRVIVNFQIRPGRYRQVVAPLAEEEYGQIRKILSVNLVEEPSLRDRESP